MPSDLYPALSRKFETHHQLAKGGAKLDYITGEQCVTRLNETLGVDGWGFEVLEHGQLGEDFWARGRLTAYFPERAVIREQFGGVTVFKNSLAPADAMKGAATDALKKAASLIGVALYLSDKDDPASHQPAPRQAPPTRQAQATRPVEAPTGTGAASRAPAESALAGGDAPTIRSVGDFWKAAQTLFRCNAGQTAGYVTQRLGREAGAYKQAHQLEWSNVYTLLEANLRDGEPIPGAPPSLGGLPTAADDDSNASAEEVSAAVQHLQSDIVPAPATNGPAVLGCAVCGNEIEETTFRDGTSWTPAKMAEISTRKHGKPLCMTHHREFNAAKLGTQREAVEA